MAPPRSPPSATAARRPQRPAAPPWRRAQRARFAAPRRRRGAAPNECRPGKIWGEQPENQKKVGKSRNRMKSWGKQGETRLDWQSRNCGICKSSNLAEAMIGHDD